MAEHTESKCERVPSQFESWRAELQDLIDCADTPGFLSATLGAGFRARLEIFRQALSEHASRSSAAAEGQPQPVAWISSYALGRLKEDEHVETVLVNVKYLTSDAPLYASPPSLELREALELARGFIDPDASPRLTNREMVAKIDAALSGGKNELREVLDRDEAKIETDMQRVIRAWVRCPTEKRPSPAALAAIIEEIASAALSGGKNAR